MRKTFALSLVLIAATMVLPALAVAQTVTPLAEARLRHEHVTQDELTDRTSDAVTARIRTGLQVAEGRWSVLAEAQGNLAIVDGYYDGLHGAAIRPLIGDPQSIGLYRALLRYSTPGFAVTAGRQRIAIDDERFVGAAAIRNNGQTFDAVRAEVQPLKGVKADVSYAWSVRTVWGIDGTGTRQQAVGGNNVFATLGWVSPIGTLTGFAYLVDQDEAAVQGYRLSSQSYGIRLAGSRPVGRGSIAWQASRARQSDWHRNPNDYRANYWLTDVAIDLAGPRLGGGYEVLGADRGNALTSFQTPLASIFKFQGWADKFTTTPADGIRDLYGSVGWGWKVIGALKAVGLSAVYHRFESDRLVRHYGNEVDLLATAKLGRTTATLRYADYRADRLFTDTRKVWLQLDWAL